MRKNLLLLTLASTLLLTQSKQRDFPSFDPLHAHCAMETVFPLQNCDGVFDNFYDTIYGFSPEPQSQGYYRVKEAERPQYIWATRETPTAHYIDDIIFVFVSQRVDGGFQCQVQARSRSQTLSYFDYNTNYCNMWTVIRAIGGYEVVETNQCPWVPDNARKICAVY